MLKSSSVFIFVFISIFSINSFAQKDAVLFKVNGEKVFASEFTRIYEKNLSLVNDPSQKEIDNYLDLYINYKLKLQEAYQLKMDTVGSYKREYDKYVNQLIQPYLKDENLELDLLMEAYERSKKEINASHILIKIEKGEDTLVAYHKINDLRERIVKGEDFAKLAQENSNDPSATKNGGNLGYFTVFQMVYPFENVAFNTPIGNVSLPFKTQFGYHIVKIHDIRDSKGEVEVAHIMLKGDYEQNQPLIENIKGQLNTGADFSELASSYSQDGGTAKNGGLLPRFGSGRMIPSFEQVAFGLQTEGEISEPFKSEFGWHIIKLIKKYPIDNFENSKTTLKQKVDQGQRAQLMGNSVINRLLKEYQIIISKEKLEAFSKVEWQENKDLRKNEVLLTIEKEKIPVLSFYDYYKKQTHIPYKEAFNTFKEQKVLDYYKSKLPDNNRELRDIMKEYKEGLLLFDMMQDKIWDRAEKDSLGLQNFFEKNIHNYKWNTRAKMVVATLKFSDSQKIVAAINQNVDIDSISVLFKDVNLIDIREDLQDITSESFPKGLTPEVSSTVTIPIGNQYKMYYIKEILPAGSKKLNEVKGRVMSDYQDQLEKNWVVDLKRKFPVKIYKKTLQSIKAKYLK